MQEFFKLPLNPKLCSKHFPHPHSQHLPVRIGQPSGSPGVVPGAAAAAASGNWLEMQPMFKQSLLVYIEVWKTMDSRLRCNSKLRA